MARFGSSIKSAFERIRYNNWKSHDTDSALQWQLNHNTYIHKKRTAYIGDLKTGACSSIGDEFVFDGGSCLSDNDRHRMFTREKYGIISGVTGSIWRYLVVPVMCFSIFFLVGSSGFDRTRYFSVETFVKGVEDLDTPITSKVVDLITNDTYLEVTNNEVFNLLTRGTIGTIAKIASMLSVPLIFTIEGASNVITMIKIAKQSFVPVDTYQEETDHGYFDTDSSGWQTWVYAEPN